MDGVALGALRHGHRVLPPVQRRSARLDAPPRVAARADLLRRGEGEPLDALVPVPDDDLQGLELFILVPGGAAGDEEGPLLGGGDAEFWVGGATMNSRFGT